MRTFGLTLSLLVLLSGGLSPVIGQNQVRRDRFDFEVLRTDHFEIHFYAEEAEMARVAARMAERWYARLSRTLSHELRGPQVIILYASHPHFQQTGLAGGVMGETTRGMTEANKRRIALPFAGPLAETDHVIGHELVHAFQFDMTESTRRRAMTQPLALRMPLWFIEGMAEYLTSGPANPITLMWVRDAAIDDRLPTLEQLSRRRDFAFRFGHGFWAYIAGRFGDDVIGRILNAAARTRDAEQAFQSVLLISPDSLAAEWVDEVRFAFADQIGITGTSKPNEDHPPPLPPAGRLDLAPALSPDGERLVYISNQNGRSVNMFMEDVGTRKNRHELALVASNPRFEYMQFIASAGEWSPDGQRFAFGSGTDADPLLVVIDKSGGRTLERRFAGIAEIFDPTWSPEGRFIAFSGLVGGQSDLFLYDTVQDSITQLTSDAYADVLPAWSPRGTSIAFSTDRFTTDLASLQYGTYRLALIDAPTGVVTSLAALDDVNHVNPQWSADGASVFFVADAGGLANVHRLDLGTRVFYRVTNLRTGAAGITALSPALTAARAADVIAFSVYEHGSYRIVTLSGEEALRGRRVGSRR